MDGCGSKEWESRETETEPQEINSGRPKDREWHCRNEEVLPNVGNMKRSKKQCRNDSKGRDLMKGIA